MKFKKTIYYNFSYSNKTLVAIVSSNLLYLNLIFLAIIRSGIIYFVYPNLTISASI